MTHQRSVLVVEDDDIVAELFQHLLSDEGMQVSLASSGVEARRALAARDYDAVVLDIRLPGQEDGLKLAEVAVGEGCGVVLMTGDHRFEKTLIASGHRYLLKPFRVERLLSAIEQAIRQSQQRARREGST
ncbi:MAG TPA: response regulator [Stellaceae bacterium]|nr:response regulator [Stellaceae bacterium]